MSDISEARAAMAEAAARMADFDSAPEAEPAAGTMSHVPGYDDQIKPESRPGKPDTWGRIPAERMSRPVPRSRAAIAADTAEVSAKLEKMRGKPQRRRDQWTEAQLERELLRLGAEDAQALNRQFAAPLERMFVHQLPGRVNN